LKMRLKSSGTNAIKLFWVYFIRWQSKLAR
jgi:hypothetical protein